MTLISRMAMGMLLICCAAACEARDPLVLWYKQPARDWQTQALPIGNGRVGCMIFGGAPSERVQFNEISLWTGDERDTGCYQDFGDIYIDLKQDAPQSYRRQLDISKAVHDVTYTSGGVTYRRQCFSSAPAQVIVMRLTADKPGSYSGTIRLLDAHGAATTAGAGRLTSAGALANGLKYESQVLVKHEGGTVAADGSDLKIEGADSLILILAARTNYVPRYDQGWRGPDPHGKLTNEIDNAAAQPYSQLLTEHVRDYRRLFDRVTLDLGPSNASAAQLPTDERMAAYAAGAPDNGLESLFFQFGRYLLISCSRPGSLPANLQGLWNDSNNPPWTCDYHANINVEMNYWPAEPTNLSECHIPFLDYINNLREVRAKQTKEDFGPSTRGWVIYTENNIFGRSRWE